MKLNVNDLLEECRQKNIFDISEVEFAILETSGRLSVQPKSQNRPLTPKDMKMPTEYEGLCANVVIDGKAIEEHLKALNLDIDWLLNELAKQNIKGHADVLLAYINRSCPRCVISSFCHLTVIAGLTQNFFLRSLFSR